MALGARKNPSKSKHYIALFYANYVLLNNSLVLAIILNLFFIGCKIKTVGKAVKIKKAHLVFVCLLTAFLIAK
jgi:hypothetical protein